MDVDVDVTLDNNALNQFLDLTWLIFMITMLLMITKWKQVGSGIVHYMCPAILYP